MFSKLKMIGYWGVAILILVLLRVFVSQKDIDEWERMSEDS